VLYFVTQLFIPFEFACVIIGIGAGVALLYMAFFSENIYFELDDNGAFRYYRRGKEVQSFRLGDCRIGYRRKSQSGIFGNHDINLQIVDGKENTVTIDAASLGVDQFTGMYEEMEKHAIKEEPVKAGKPKEE
jgi:hypothetical protein